MLPKCHGCFHCPKQLKSTVAGRLQRLGHPAQEGVRSEHAPSGVIEALDRDADPLSHLHKDTSTSEGRHQDLNKKFVLKALV